LTWQSEFRGDTSAKEPHLMKSEVRELCFAHQRL
jgi:hypothetical protein